MTRETPEDSPKTPAPVIPEYLYDDAAEKKPVMLASCRLANPVEVGPGETASITATFTIDDADAGGRAASQL